MNLSSRVSGSFRDPNGFVFKHNQTLYRQLNSSYKPHYDWLMSSGLYERLVCEKLLLAHVEVDAPIPIPENAYRFLQPEPVQFLSFPYEWCFSQLKDAAFLTLIVQRIALEYGMTLVDASAYNIQFHHGRPILIDTLSFEIYQEGTPWTGYQQFCQHFLAPLALMAHCDIRLSSLLVNHIDGIPLDYASRLLPLYTRLNFGLLTHIHLHSNFQKQYAGRELPSKASNAKFSKTAFFGLIESLAAAIRGQNWNGTKTSWAGYYTDNNYSEAAFEAKTQSIRAFLEIIGPKRVLDLGANIGIFSRIAAEMGIETISTDYDPGAVELNYQEVRRREEENLLPLLLDLTNPSPAIGWENKERAAFFQRYHVDAIMALALVHHLAIANNLPLGLIAEFFSHLAHWTILEFVPKEDSQALRLLRNRRDVFSDYHVDGFEATFAAYFTIREKRPLPESKRLLYLLERKI